MTTTPATQQPALFAPTRWTVVLRARGDSAESRQALGDLCEAYWTPVFRYLLNQGRAEDTARELTQEFFARLLSRGSLGPVEPERGRFRSYLLGAVKHFLADWQDHERRLKRGAGLQPVSLDALDESGTSASLQIPDPGATPPDSFFDRAWALAIMDRALAALQREFNETGKGDHFEQLKPWLAGETPQLSQAEAASKLGLNEGAVKVAIHRLRKRFRELVRAELAQTVNAPGEVDEELRYLLEALAQAAT